MKFDPADTTVSAPSKEAVDKVLKDELPAVEASYNEEIMKYRTPHRVVARQILRKLPAGASDADVAKVRGLLLDLRSQIEAGADFGSLARESSEDAATKVKGGDLGTLERGHNPKELEDAIFVLKKDEVTAEPVRVKDALVLVQVTDVQPPSRKKLDDVKEEVAFNLLKSRLAEEVANKEAEGLHAKLAKGEAIEKLTKGENEPKEPPTPEKAPKAAKGAKAGKGAKTEKAANAAQLPTRYDTAWVLKSQGAIPRIGASRELHDEVFALTKEAPLTKGVYKIGKSYFVVLLKDRETPDPAKFDSEKDTLRQQALWAKRTKIYREWLGHLKQTTRVQYNPSLVMADKDARG